MKTAKDTDTIDVITDPSGRVTGYKMEQLVPSTPEQDLAAMRKVWEAQRKSKVKPYTSKSVLRASGGEYPRSSAFWKERHGR